MREFKEIVKSEGLYCQYTETSEFAHQFRQQLDMAMHAVLESDEFVSISADMQRQEVTLLPEACSVLAVASVADSSRIILSRSQAGRELSTGGVILTVTGNSRSEARWEAGLAQLEQVGFAEDLGHKREVFRVTSGGYEAADELWHVLLLRRIASLQEDEHDYVDIPQVIAAPVLGFKLTAGTAREKLNALVDLEAIDAVTCEGETAAARINDKGRKTVREHAWLEFAEPDVRTSG